MFNQHQSARRLGDSGIKVCPAYPIIAMQISTKTGTEFSQCGSMMGGRNDETICSLAFVHKSRVRPITGEKNLKKTGADKNQKEIFAVYFTQLESSSTVRHLLLQRQEGFCKINNFFQYSSLNH